MTVTAERTDRVGLSVVAAVVVVAVEAARLLLLDRFRWELGYPETYAVQGVLFTLVYLTYAAVLVWRGRTFVRRITAPLLLLVPWLFDSFWLVMSFLMARGPFDLPSGEWWLWMIRLQMVVTVLCLTAAWGIARRRGYLWLVGLVVPGVLMLVWIRWADRAWETLGGQPVVSDLFMMVSTVAIPLIGCLACWGVEALSRTARPAQVAAA
ncbi:hypothetical protein ACFV9G_00430 [Nocardioides sp. NPDC059952]|uniref:hypothetical protein n=1 Tax=Nocardioides sp. NPDC059952 TaxID=3347014 RepID=UPI00365CE9C2